MSLLKVVVSGGRQHLELATEGEDFATSAAPGEAVAGHEGSSDPHPEYQQESEKGAANGYASLNANQQVVETVLRILATAAALAPTEGCLKWDSTRKIQAIYDAARERAASDMGWMPYAYPVVFQPAAAFTAAFALAANGGSLALPILVNGHMLLQSVSIRNTDTATERTWGWDLYEDRTNTSNTLDRIAASAGSETFTPSAASTRTLDAASAPAYLGPGLYWLVIQCRHASNDFGIAYSATSGGFSRNVSQSKTTTNPNGSTLDLVAATWTKNTNMHAARLNGRVFGESTSF